MEEEKIIQGEGPKEWQGGEKRKRKGTDLVAMSNAAELEGYRRFSEFVTFRNTWLTSCYAL